MARWTLPMRGGCRCDKVRFEIIAPPMLAMVCHCTGCQKMTASAFSTSIAVPTDGFRVLQGEPVIGGMHSSQGRHHHCDWCKSWIFTRVVPEMGFVNVRATMLDDVSWFAPFVETYTSEGLPWAKTGATHSFFEFPPMEAYQSLIADYAQAHGG